MIDADSSPVTHDLPMSAELAEALAQGWDPSPTVVHPGFTGSPAVTAGRRAALSALLGGTVLVIGSGNRKVRANDTYYAFRSCGSFSWLTGESIEDAVLVMFPASMGHHATLYLREYVSPGELGYFTDRQYGALWVGNVPDLAGTAKALGLHTRPLTALADDLARYRDYPLAALTGGDSALDAFVSGSDPTDLGPVLDELRLVKDQCEIGLLQKACEATARGFADVAQQLPGLAAAGTERAERWLEGTFWRRARLEGNDVGYTSILAAGAHGTSLHWTRNDGRIRDGDLLLADMGVETSELYTADITRTLPVSGTFSPVQLKVYRAVLEAQDAGIAELRAGNDFAAGHRAAMWVLADHLHSWGLLPVTADVSCNPDVQAPGAGLHRRWTLHSTSHMLGIDVHDCALARAELYTAGTLASGQVLTMEPGLYFQVNDRTVPDELRGLAVRIEDDIVITSSGPVNLSASLPRAADEVAAWLRAVQQTPPDYLERP